MVEQELALHLMQVVVEGTVHQEHQEQGEAEERVCQKHQSVGVEVVMVP